jgi:anaphase-promoting complex subunit 10
MELPIRNGTFSNPGGPDRSMQAASTEIPPTPHGLKEISSLASWTVSSSKPGCSVAALRAPTTAQFWQSDGPQPHYLNIHFFKMVTIVGMRVFLDYELDESYTPTLIRFAAGTGYNDLQEFSVMRFEQPRGWIEVDWDGVGELSEGDHIHNPDFPILRCMLVQVRVCENHQNGKDTHLRGFQIFARDSIGNATARNPVLSEPVAESQLPKTSSKKSDKSLNLDLDMDLDDWLETPTLR